MNNNKILMWGMVEIDGVHVTWEEYESDCTESGYDVYVNLTHEDFFEMLENELQHRFGPGDFEDEIQEEIDYIKNNEALFVQLYNQKCEDVHELCLDHYKYVVI